MIFLLFNSIYFYQKILFFLKNKNMQGLLQDHECLRVNSKYYCQLVQKSTTVYSNFNQFSDLCICLVTKNANSTKLYQKGRL